MMIVLRIWLIPGRRTWVYKKMKFYLVALLFILLAPLILSAAKQTTDPAETPITPTSIPTPISTTTPKPLQYKPLQQQDTLKTLIIHKPQSDPSWGKVIQYHRELSGGPNDKTREILHEFLFQDNEGVVRTAIFHEDSSGDGYWEVWVWDQP